MAKSKKKQIIKKAANVSSPTFPMAEMVPIYTIEEQIAFIQNIITLCAPGHYSADIYKNILANLRPADCKRWDGTSCPQRKAIQKL